MGTNATLRPYSEVYADYQRHLERGDDVARRTYPYACLHCGTAVVLTGEGFAGEHGGGRCMACDAGVSPEMGPPTVPLAFPLRVLRRRGQAYLCDADGWMLATFVPTAPERAEALVRYANLGKREERPSASLVVAHEMMAQLNEGYRALGEIKRLAAEAQAVNGAARAAALERLLARIAAAD